MILTTKNITKSFGRKKVLKGISMEIPAGSICGIAGENGSGKSTLLKIIVGIWKASSGQVLFDGSFGYCPQEVQLFPSLTIDEHLRLFSAAYELEPDKSKDKAAELLSYFKFEKYRHEKVATMSGGTQQKLNLTIALLHEPDLLILDEPYNGFDWDTYVKFWDYTEEYRALGGSILIVTHLVAEKSRYDNLYNLEDGYLL